jgi:UDP-glucose 4-epimerase
VPYDVPWSGCDIGARAPDAEVVAHLARAFSGADAVVHLAWQIQPSHDRDRLRRTNVDGTRRVLEAASVAGVPHVVVASSVGAYRPVDDDVPRDEDWPVGAAPTSSAYSVDKAAVERLLDAWSGRLAITRLRPALVFQRAAASAIERYFLGPAAPAHLLRRPLPVLPWPRGVRVQAVHADDVASAVLSALAIGATGSFNLAADDVLRRDEVAALVSSGRAVDVPVPVARAALAAAWRLRAVHLGPGWLDLAAGVPLLDTSRARDVLGWAPTWSATAALGELLDGLAAGAGTVSPVLRPRRRARPSLSGGQSSQT